MRAHLTANLTRTGRQTEVLPYFESANRVMASARAFNEAEFDWCLRAWPDDTREDAELRVQQVADAAAELEHADDLTGLANAAGLQLHRNVIGFVVHDGEDDETFDHDPFGITRD